MILSTIKCRKYSLISVFYYNVCSIFQFKVVIRHCIKVVRFLVKGVGITNGGRQFKLEPGDKLSSHPKAILIATHIYLR